jgi:predicted dehydrogenase
MAALAAEQGVRTVVGLQARQAPAITFVQELLSDGYVGEVLSTTMVGLSVLGDVVVQPNAYMLDKSNGANVLTVAVGHSLDLLNYVLGEFADLSAVSDLRRPLITIEETGEQIVKTAADQIAVIGTLASGATASIHVREAVAGGTGFLWEINGTDGTLRITADAAQPQIFPLTVAGARGGNEPAELAARRHRRINGPRSPAWKERPPTTSGVRTRHSRQTSTTGLTPCRASPTPSGATRSSPPSSDPRH